MRELYLRTSAAAASSTSRGTSTARSGKSCASTTAGCSRNAIRWATNEAPPVEVEGPGLLDVTVWRQRDSMTVHLVNLTNPMMMKGPLREIIPVGPERVRIRLPPGSAPRRVQLLTARTTPRVETTTACSS